MIIPQIQFSADASPDSIVELIQHWSLFGQVALVDVPSASADALESIVKRVGGSVDLLIGLSDPTEESGLALLNAGATSLLGDASAECFTAIPPERIATVSADVANDEAIPVGALLRLADPTSDRIAELEMARFDSLVAIEKLEPELIADFFQAVLVTDRPDGLWSTMIVDPIGIALGLAYSNYESLLHALETRCGTYWSRSRDGLWIKGETSGATQQLLGIRMDCDRDCLRFTVTQDPPGFCHRDTHTCFGSERTIQSVMQRLSERIHESDEKSFTRKLANNPEMLESKLLEEAKELSVASQADDLNEIAWEAADVLYFALVAMLKNGVSLDRVYHELARRMNRVVRRPPGLKNDPETT
ncbi:MAG: phosphoribosyl-ATP pyrophosphohydrolase [Mariniblastus sp.]|jgi:phosphoribosyl-ATP pyrophosphohydrolase